MNPRTLNQIKNDMHSKKIERIEVHNNDKYDGHYHFKVDIYFTLVGMMDIPDEKEIQAMMEEMKNNPKTLKYAS